MDNYGKELDKVLEGLGTNSGGIYKSLLLHSCCAPCSSYVLEYLREYFDITVLYYNPNIGGVEEYNRRAEEQKRLIAEYNRQVRDNCFGGMHSTSSARTIKVIEGAYETNRFDELSKGLEQCPEGGQRCFKCYELRLEKTAQLAAEKNFHYFTTTLTVSPHKNAVKLNEIGKRMEEKYGVLFLHSDFKKKDGYKRSIELSGLFGLYRQNFCGCAYSSGMPLRNK